MSILAIVTFLCLFHFLTEKNAHKTRCFNLLISLIGNQLCSGNANMHLKIESAARLIAEIFTKQKQL